MSKTTKPATKATIRTIQRKFAAMRKDMKNGMIERDTEVDIVLSAMLCREHVNLVSEPGTAKSLLLDTVLQWVDGTTKVSALMSRHTSPEELFGPVDVMGLKNGEYRRITKRRLPEASFAFLDEIYKAGPSILNTILRILNERQFDNGEGGLMDCPLSLCVAASNEWPGEDNGGAELGALFDRFLFRRNVTTVSKQGRQRLLRARDLKPQLSTKITMKEINTACDAAAELEFTDAAWAALDNIIEALNEAGIFPGDRRMRKSVSAVRAFAFLCGDSEVQPHHLEITAHTLWIDPSEQPATCESIVVRLSNPEAARVAELLVQAADVISNSPPVESVPKLKEIQAELAEMSSDRAVEGYRFVKNEITRLFSSIVGA